MTGVHRWARILFSATVIAAAAACSGNGGTEVETFESWLLVSLNDQPPPTAIGGGMGYTEYLDSAMIEFRRYSRLLEIQHRRRVFTFTPDTTRSSDSATFAYTLTDGMMIVYRPAYLSSDDWADTGTYSATQLTLRVRRGAPGGYVHDEWTYVPEATPLSRRR